MNPLDKEHHIVMSWNEMHQQYLMTSYQDNRMIYNFWDCGGVRMIFKNIDKTTPRQYLLSTKEVILMDEKKKAMDISIVITIGGESTTTNEFKIQNAPKETVIQLEKLLIEALTRFMSSHER